MKTALLFGIALLTMFALPTVSAAPPGWGPLVGVCVKDVTAAQCWNDGTVCVGFSYQVPFCVRGPPIVCTEICNPCMTIRCDTVACDPTLCDPCYVLIDCDPIPVLA